MIAAGAISEVSLFSGRLLRVFRLPSPVFRRDAARIPATPLYFFGLDPDDGRVNHDVIVVGSDPAGLEVAVQAARRGLTVLLATGKSVRPASTTSLIARRVVGELTRAFVQIRSREVHCGRRSVLRAELDAILSEALRDSLTRYDARVRGRLERARVRTQAACQRVNDDRSVQLDDGSVHRARHLVIATGTRARRPRQFPYDDRSVLDDDAFLATGARPRSLVLVGAGAAGCELASTFGSLGTHVTLVDRRDSLLRAVDREILELLHRQLRRIGVDVVLSEEISGLRVETAGEQPHVWLDLASGRSEVCEQLVVVAGREPDGEVLRDLPGIATTANGFVHVDPGFRTSLPGIYAVGGVVDAISNAPVAHQARAVVSDVCGEPASELEPEPLVIRTVPMIASWGLSEEACRRLDVPYVVGTASGDELPQPQIADADPLFLKLVVHRTERFVLGVHVVGHAAAELVAVGAMVARQRLAVSQLAALGCSDDANAAAFSLAAEEATRALRGARRKVGCPKGHLR